MKLIKMSEENLRAIESLQEVIELEEEQNYSYDEILKRVIKFYKMKIGLN